MRDDVDLLATPASELDLNVADIASMGWPQFWLSFVDPKRPEGDRFLGVAIVEAPSAMDAVQMAWALGCNPGGEVKIIEVSSDLRFAPTAIGRLMGKEEALALKPATQ